MRTEDFRKSFADNDEDNRGSVVTIGNFDGCHLGHQALVKKTVSNAQRLDHLSVCITFDPHPFEVIFKKPKDLLFTLEQKEEALRSLGLDLLIIQSFTPRFRELSRDVFYLGLKNNLRAKVIVIGDDFTFGKKREGDCFWLSKQTKIDHIQLDIIKPKIQAQCIVKSSQIRSFLLDKGDVETAATLLSRPYALEGVVISGQNLGEKIGFPTVNLGHIKQLIPKKGVYCGYIRFFKEPKEGPRLKDIFAGRFASVFNIGVRPTVSKSSSLSVEGHILGYPDCFPKRLDDFHGFFYFVYRIRDEMKFKSIEELKVQINKDCMQAKKLLNV